jgi:hypothetical protein
MQMGCILQSALAWLFTAAAPDLLCCSPWLAVLQWMSAVDTIITKAGPGTIAEALISGLPILLNGNVPCQVR